MSSLVISEDTNLVKVGALYSGTGGNSSVRNVTASTSDPSGGNNGDMWAKYV